jgi:dihydrofolate reductase
MILERFQTRSYSGPDSPSGVPSGYGRAINDHPRILLSVAMSLDGFIADYAGGVEWLNPYFSDEMDFAGFMADIGAIVVGRTTYEVAGGFGGGGKRLVVLTHRPIDGVEAWDGDPRELARRLKAECIGTIWVMGGGQAARSLLDAEVIDEIDVNVVPTLLGSGTPLFPARSGSDRLDLLECQQYENGCVRLHYCVARKDP